MPGLNEVIDGICGWLRGTEFTPAVREVAAVELLPAAAYPRVLVLAGDEEPAVGGAGTRARATVVVSHAGGRPAIAREEVRDLAFQVRVALNRSHGLGGLVKHLAVTGVSYGRRDRTVEGGVVVTAELEISLHYCAGALTD